jgi:aspartyl-tRNA(Asn)/glutamyl-tRNA(Gln) amidotransferase subunit C
MMAMADTPKPLPIETVRKVASLSRLALSDQQQAKYAAQLGSVLGYIERLNELNLEGVLPLTNPMDATNRLGEDTPSAAPGPGSTRVSVEDLMKMAPASLPPYVRVPKVLGDGGGA